MKNVKRISVIWIMLLTAWAGAADLATLPVREVRVFKDGHAMVVHKGVMDVNDEGNIEIDDLPRPILGTFWAFSDQEDVALKTVRSSKRLVTTEKTPLNYTEILRANIGKRVRIQDNFNSEPFEATVKDVLRRDVDEINALRALTSSMIVQAQESHIVLLDVETAPKRVRAMPVNNIRHIEFLDDYMDKVSDEELRDLMTLELSWEGREQAQKAAVGMAYIERGIRWIPSYRVDIDGKGKAKVVLQGTLVNELVDLKDVTTHLVIGVPSFLFQDQVDPISLQHTVAQIESQMNRQGANQYNYLSNAIMTQQRMSYNPQAQPSAGYSSALNLGPEVASEGKREDLFVYTLNSITLKKGERMQLQLAEFEMDYTDIYTLDLPLTPPSEIMQNISSSVQRDMLQLLHSPKVMHKIRLQNATNSPTTTAPVLLFKEGKVMAQSLMTYSPSGGIVDVDLTTAIDIGTLLRETEKGTTPNALNMNGHNYSRIDIAGSIQIKNLGEKPTKIEVRRTVAGLMDTVSDDGKKEQASQFDFNRLIDLGVAGNYRQHFNWPNWWQHLNGIGQATWTIELEPGKEQELTYEWHYFWR